VDVYGLQFVQCGQLSRDVTRGERSNVSYRILVEIRVILAEVKNYKV
jgi:hypothetical protein